ncbi:NADH-quinone oxidoreductase subunit L [Halomonas sp. TRM85114]|uniref:NADH-quinone oxidoreductase subunit L n=1 Tax=Halomonas jincaotanensis TaxID=2810616 RepID=UPI001BD2C168|nr:NADH-quinone oxidoreductase subunit L [Halomonas jincaotanensis]MBS9404668.1 NADH-quinone oxidoreductase subunit L [Halomonas jincaotanensis]
MSWLLPLTFLLPLGGMLALVLWRGDPGRRLCVAIGVGSAGGAALVTAFIVTQFLATPEPHTVTLWTWIAVGNFRPTIGLALDGLSLTLLGVITGVGFLIHLFAAWYMHDEPGVRRFYAYLNLFVASMVLLVLGDNLLLLFLGWEGVGLCSYLLIGHYHQVEANGRAAFKAFIVTRTGDVFLAIGLFLLFHQLGTLNIALALERVPALWAEGDPMVELAALLLLAGALGKSAQLPLHTWLADAMAGPTPVSALIHAATMVTAGVYLIARMHEVFLLAPGVLYLTGVIGALTLLSAGCAALAQTDIKRVLAYSTMSQIGYMFLALGVGAFEAAVVHLMTHAFFKALLFLSAGAVIVGCHHEQDMRRLGGLWRRLPLAYAGFIAGGAALVALPLVSAGFYSKDEILWRALVSGQVELLAAGLLGTFLTSLYTLRLIVHTFHGEPRSENARQARPGHGWAHAVPLILLVLLSTFFGAWVEPPLAGVFPEPDEGSSLGHTLLEVGAISIVLSGLALGGWLLWRRGNWLEGPSAQGPGAALWRLWYHDWGSDALYDRLLVQPYRQLVGWLRDDAIDSLVTGVARLAWWSHLGLARTQTGQLRLYLVILSLGVVLILLVLAVGV